MDIKIKTGSKAIDLIADEVIKTKSNEGLSLDRWTIVLEICTYRGIPCQHIVVEINQKVRKITPGYRGLKLLSFDDCWRRQQAVRRTLLQKLDKHLGSTHLANL